MNEQFGDVRAIQLPRWGQVATDPDVVPWPVFDEEGGRAAGPQVPDVCDGTGLVVQPTKLQLRVALGRRRGRLGQ